MRLTKIDVAQAHICSAVRLFFLDEHPASVYTLAASAREILTTIGDKIGVETVLHDYVSKSRTSLKEAVSVVHEYANFLKHADRDPESELDFPVEHAREVLIIACKDFGFVTGGMPVEAQIYEAWWWATQTRSVQALSRDDRRIVLNILRLFPPGIRTASESDQKKMGLRMLSDYEKDANLQMDIKRVVEIPKTQK